MKQAVCTLLRNPEGKILGVSRRNDPDNMNLPGGKVDPGETLEEACIRETQEETNLRISNLRLVFHRPCEGEDTYEAYCFEADYEGEPKALEEGFVVRWITWDELLLPTNQFAHYNKRLYDKLHLNWSAVVTPPFALTEEQWAHYAEHVRTGSSEGDEK